VGISIRAPFFVYAATLAAATAVCWFYLKDPPQREDGDAPGAKPSAAAERPLPLRTALRDRAYWAALATNLGNGFSIFGLRSALVPLFVVEGMRRGPGLTGLGFLVAAAVQAVLLLPAGRWADQRGRRPAMILGSAASVAGMVLLAVGTGLWTFFAAMAVFGVSGAFLGPAPTAVVGDITHGRPGGTVVAAYQMVSDFGAIVGPLAAGLVLDAAGFGAAFAVGAVIVGLGLLASIAMPETLGRRAADSGTMAA
jgi:MFS family permease